MADDYQPNRQGMAALLRSSDMQACCMEVARDWVPRVAAKTPRDSGDTAASTRAEEDRLPDGTAGSKVVQEGASVQQNWGNARARAQRHLYEAFGGGA